MATLIDWHAWQIALDGGLMTTSTASIDTSVEDRRATGERARENAPIAAQADWEPAERPDPVELLIEQTPRARLIWCR